MRKILFITPSFGSSYSGGAVGSKRSYDMLCHFFGKANVDIRSIDERPNKGLFQKIVKNVYKYATSEQFDLRAVKNIQVSNYDGIYLDTSLIGKLAEFYKKNGYQGKIITHFHNCEYDLNSQMYGGRNLLIRYPLLKIPRENESMALKYSDANIVLNKRDASSLEKHYHESDNMTIIPVTMPDRFKPSESSTSASIETKPLYTFLGSNFKPNVDGITWFINEVFPHVDIRLRVIGRGMGWMSEKYHLDNFEVLSDVPNLDPYMEESDYMLYPIFEGSGMKLKTCEALMFGKNIIGTDESFCGYDIDDYSKIGAKCNSKEEFISAINSLRLPHFNQYSRDLFVQKYSYEAAERYFGELFNKLGLL